MSAEDDIPESVKEESKISQTGPMPTVDTAPEPDVTVEEEE